MLFKGWYAGFGRGCGSRVWYNEKSDLTGSVSSITSDNFKLGTDLTPQQLMQGAFSGVNISQNSGKPGGSNTIRVRGGTSITASNDPCM